MLDCILLCCTMLLCVTLLFAVLCCAVLCCVVLCCVVLCCAVLCCAVLAVLAVLSRPSKECHQLSQHSRLILPVCHSAVCRYVQTVLLSCFTLEDARTTTLQRHLTPYHVPSLTGRLMSSLFLASRQADVLPLPCFKACLSFVFCFPSFVHLPDWLC